MWPRITAEPCSPGRALPSYQAARLDSSNGGTAIEWSAATPTATTGALTWIAGIRSHIPVCRPAAVVGAGELDGAGEPDPGWRRLWPTGDGGLAAVVVVGAVIGVVVATWVPAGAPP